MHYDYLVVGAGLFGAAFAQRMLEAEKSVLVIEKRDHIGGNVFTEEVEGIQVHRYTGPIDAYFGYCCGPLAYRSVRFETEVLDMPNFQGNAVVNYTDRETPFTRIIEHKHFEFGTQSKTVISREYSQEWEPGMEPYYPVNDEKNTALYEQYRALAEKEPNILFGGRLGQYRYYDMDAVLLSALELAEKEKEGTL